MIGWIIFGLLTAGGLLVLAKIALGAPSATDRRIARVSLLATLAVLAGAWIGHLLNVWGIA